MSARDGLLSRLVLGGRATKQDLAKFRALAFGRKSAPRSDEEMRVKAEEMLEDSGLLALEQRIFAFLYGHSAPLKLLSLVDDCQRLLHQVGVASALLTMLLGCCMLGFSRALLAACSPISGSSSDVQSKPLPERAVTHLRP